MGLIEDCVRVLDKMRDETVVDILVTRLPEFQLIYRKANANANARSPYLSRRSPLSRPLTPSSAIAPGSSKTTLNKSCSIFTETSQGRPHTPSPTRRQTTGRTQPRSQFFRNVSMSPEKLRLQLLDSREASPVPGSSSQEKVVVLSKLNGHHHHQ